MTTEIMGPDARGSGSGSAKVQGLSPVRQTRLFLICSI
jgi:hypothetical protein